MQLKTTKIGIYQVRCTYYLSSIFHFFLDRQFRGDVVRKKNRKFSRIDIRQGSSFSTWLCVDGFTR